MIPLPGDPEAGGKRDALEGRTNWLAPAAVPLDGQIAAPPTAPPAAAVAQASGAAAGARQGMKHG